MTRHRVLLIVAGACLFVAASVAAVIVVTGGQSTSGSHSPSLTAHAPSDRAQHAMQALDAPSVPGPLPGSSRTADTGYVIAGGCDAARARYLAPGAPLPPGARASAADGGVIMVDDQFGVSAIFFKDGSGACYYTVITKPTVSFAGKGVAPSGDAFSPVGCFLPVDQGGSETTITSLGGKPYVVQVGPTGGSSLNEPYDPSKGETAIIFQGTLSELSAATGGSDTPNPAAFAGRGGIYPAKVAADADGTIRATLTSGDASGTVIALVCTGDVTSIVPPSPTPSP